MFFNDDHKKAVTIIMSKRNGATGERTMSPTPMKDEEVKHEDGEMNGLHAAAQDLMAAHHEKSPMKLMEAMSNFINIHKTQSEAEPK